MLFCTFLLKALPYLQYNCSSDSDGYYVSDTETNLTVTQAESCGFYPGSAITCVVFASNEAGDGDNNQDQITLSCLSESGIYSLFYQLFSD